jgi:hypothetical protein
MLESEIRTELLRLLPAAAVEHIMDMIADYVSEERSEAASDAMRDYEERCD